VCLFVDGCFWHGCALHFLLPKTHSAWWREKIEDNRARDERQQRQLEERGWVVVRLWEHEVRANLRRCVRVVRKLVAMAGAAPTGTPAVTNLPRGGLTP
jgi:DNA mismatch endonuclease (patch repair protein)